MNCFLFHYATVEQTKELSKILNIPHIYTTCDVADPQKEAEIIRKIVVDNSVDDIKERFENKVEKLLLVDGRYNLKGLITIKDIEKTRKYPDSCKDARGRLRVGAAVGVAGDRETRIAALLHAGADVIVIDTAHGHSQGVLDAVTATRKNFDCQLIVGNVATAAGTKALIKAGADAIKVGIGPGSICTTRIVAGIGVPQVSALMACSQAAEASGVPIIADGGIRFSGDVCKALAAGADEIAVFGSASEGFSQKNINASIAESLERFAPLLEQAQCV